MKSTHQNFPSASNCCIIANLIFSTSMQARNAGEQDTLMSNLVSSNDAEGMTTVFYGLQGALKSL